jgi:hypothetical protein
MGPQLHSFAAGIRQDLQAVTNGLTLPHSSGAIAISTTALAGAV